MRAVDVSYRPREDPTVTPMLSQRPVEARSSVAQLHVGRRRSKWQVAGAATVVVVCATVAAVTYAQATKQVGIVVASTPMPAGTVISAADLRVGHVVAGSGVTGVAPSAVSTLVGRGP